MCSNNRPARTRNRIGCRRPTATSISLCGSILQRKKFWTAPGSCRRSSVRALNRGPRSHDRTGREGDVGLSPHVPSNPMSSEGQADYKRRSLICTSAVCLDTPSVEFDDFANNGQPESQTGRSCFWRSILLPESIEYKRQEFRVDALARVRDGALDVTTAPRHPQRNGPTSGSKLEWVVQQIY